MKNIVIVTKIMDLSSALCIYFVSWSIKHIE